MKDLIIDGSYIAGQLIFLLAFFMLTYFTILGTSSINYFVTFAFGILGISECVK